MTITKPGTTRDEEDIRKLKEVAWVRRHDEYKGLNFLYID